MRSWDDGCGVGTMEAAHSAQAVRSGSWEDAQADLADNGSPSCVVGLMGLINEQCTRPATRGLSIVLGLKAEQGQARDSASQLDCAGRWRHPDWVPSSQ